MLQLTGHRLVVLDFRGGQVVLTVLLLVGTVAAPAARQLFAHEEVLVVARGGGEGGQLETGHVHAQQLVIRDEGWLQKEEEEGRRS